jgi:STE24 endopeptidase
MEIDVARQQKAREYARTRRRISYISAGIGVVVILLVLGARIDIWLRNIIQGAASWLPLLNWQPRGDWFPWQIVVYCLIAFLFYEILTFPLSYYAGYTLPHRYGISIMRKAAWFRELGISLLLSLLLEIIFVSLLYTLLAFQPQLWWLWLAIIILFFSVLMANLAPILLYPIFYKFTPLPESELTQRLLALVARANTKVRGIYSMHMSKKTTGTNAALMGLGNTRRIVLGDTMTDNFTVDEIEVVLAHELGHHVHNDIWKLIISQTISMLLGLFIGSLILHWVVDQQHYYRSLTDPATLPFFVVLLGIFSLLIMPLNNGITRIIEYQADEYALQATGKIEDFKSAMRRLANQNLAEVEPAPIIEFLFYSHPSINKRLQHADTFASHQDYKASTSLRAEN